MAVLWCLDVTPSGAPHPASKRERQVLEIHLGLHVHVRREGRKKHCHFFTGKRTSNESGAQYRGPVRSDWSSFVDNKEKTDNEPALTGSIESWRTTKATKSGPSMNTENRSGGSSKSNAIVERAIQCVQGMIRTIRSAIAETWEVKINVTHSVWP